MASSGQTRPTTPSDLAARLRWAGTPNYGVLAGLLNEAADLLLKQEQRIESLVRERDWAESSGITNKARAIAAEALLKGEGPYVQRKRLDAAEARLAAAEGVIEAAQRWRHVADFSAQCAFCGVEVLPHATFLRGKSCPIGDLYLALDALAPVEESGAAAAHRGKHVCEYLEMDSPCPYNSGDENSGWGYGPLGQSVIAHRAEDERLTPAEEKELADINLLLGKDV